MASRVNTVFVIVLCSGLILLVGGFTAAYFLLIDKSAAQYETLGDDLASQGQIKRAATNYLKGVRKDQDNYELIQKYVDAARDMPVNTKRTARTTLGNIQHLKYEATKYRRSDQQVLEDYYQLLMEMARKLGPGFYNRLHEQSNSRLSNDPDNLIARKYRGIAQTQVMTPDLPEAEIQQALTDLSTAQKAEPKDTEVLYHIALWKLKEAARLDRPGGQPEKSAKLRNQALEVSKAMLSIDPKSPHRLARRLQVLLNTQIDDREKARPVLKTLEQALRKTPSPLYRVALAARALEEVDQETGVDRARKLLNRAVEETPDATAPRVLLGQALRKEGNLDGAYAAFEKAAKPVQESSALQWLRSLNFKRRALYQMGRVSLSKARKSQGKTRDTWLTRAENAADRLDAEMDQQSGQVQMLRGKLALLRDEPAKALTAFQKANQVYQDQNLEVLLGIADAAEQLNEWGEAVNRIEAVITRRPDLVPLRLRLISILLERPIPENLESAQRHLDSILASAPRNAQALRLQARLYTQRGEFKKAMAIYDDRLDSETGKQLIGPRIRAYLAAGKTDQARKLVREQFDQHPANIGLAQQLLRLTDDRDNQLAILDQAAEAGADKQLLKLFRQQVTGEKVQVDQVAQMIAQRSGDPFKAALAEARVYAKAGQNKKARAAIQRATELNPDSPRIVEIQFRVALAEKNFDKAKQLADQAEKLNLDQAHGRFYTARLYAAQNELPKAIATIRQGLKIRPVYSDGWRLLGMMLQRQAKHEDAVEALSKAVEQQPDDAQAMRRLAASQRELGNEQQALETIRQAWRNAPGNNAVFGQYVAMEQALGDADRALEARVRRAEQNPDDATNRRALAVLMAQQDRADEALSTMNALIGETGQTRANVATLAAVQRLTGKPDAGLEAINKYLANRGDQVQLEDRLLKARYLGRIGRDEQMAQAYRQAITGAGDVSRSVQREFANRMFEQGQIGRALALFGQLHDENPNDLAVTLRMAEILLRQGKTDRAKQLIRSSERAESSSTGAVIRAMAARQEKDEAAALEILNKAISKANRSSDSTRTSDSARAMLQFQRGRIFASQSKNDQAVEALRKALDANPSLTQARMLLAQSLLKTRRRDAATTELTKVLDDHPTNASARVQLLNNYAARNQLTAARNLLSDAMERFPDQARWPVMRAQLANKANRPKQAERYWRKALDLQANPQVLSSLVGLVLDQGRADEALSLLDAHPELVGSQLFLQAQRARGLLVSGKRDQGEQLFRRVMQRVQNPGQMKAVVGQIRAGYSAPSQAIALLRSTPLATKEPASPKAQELAMALAQLEMAVGDYDQALKRLHRLRANLGSDQRAMKIRTRRWIGMAHHEAGQYAKARSTYENLLDYAPNDVRTLNNLSFLLAEAMDQPEQALPLAKKAVEHAPSNARILDTLGWTQYKLKQLDQARQTLERAVRLNPVPDAMYHLATVQTELAEQTNDPTQAEQFRADARATIHSILGLPSATGGKQLKQDAQTLLNRLDSKATSRSTESSTP